MNFLDILILVFLVFFLIRGYKKGIISEAFQIGGLVAAFYFSSPVSAVISKIIIANYEIDGKIVNLASGILAFIIILLIFVIIGKIVTKASGIVMLSIPNKFFGAIFGVIKGFFIVTLIILVLRFTPFSNFVYDNIEYNNEIDNTVNKIEKVLTEGTDVTTSKKEVSETLTEATNIDSTTILTTPDSLSIDSIIVDNNMIKKLTSNKSTLGYLAFKLSTLLDPIAKNIKIFFAEQVNENLDLIKNIKEIIPNSEETTE